MKKNLSNAYLSCFFIGFLPFAPGTYGSVLGALFVYFLNQQIFLWSHSEKILLLGILIVALSISSTLLIKSGIKNQSYDQSWIVIDEFIGMIIAALPVFWIQEKVFITLFIAFICFRFFDIVKPLGIKKIDQMPHSWAVVLDDIVAGLYAIIIVLLFSFIILK